MRHQTTGRGGQRRGGRFRKRFFGSAAVVDPRQRRRRFRWWLKATGCLLLGLGGTYLIETARETLVHSDVFKVQRVEMAGLNHLMEKDIMSLIEVDPSGRIFEVDLESLRDRFLSHPWIKEVRVRKTYPDTLMIRVSERSPAAVIEEGNRRVMVDESGQILRTLPVSQGKNVSNNHSATWGGKILPVIRGIDIKKLRGSEPGERGEVIKALTIMKFMGPPTSHFPFRIGLGRSEGVVVDRDGYRIWFGTKEFRDKWDLYQTVKLDMSLRKREIKEVDLRFSGQVIVR